MQFRAIRACDDAGVVAGGDEVGVELLGELPELAELQPGVADDARVRRPAAEVFVGEVVDDPVELCLEVEGVERDVELVGDAASVAGIDGRAAALLVVGAAVGFVRVRAGPHEQADHVVPLLLQKHGRSRAVHPAAHRQHHSPRHNKPRNASTDYTDFTDYETHMDSSRNLCHRRNLWIISSPAVLRSPGG